MSCVWCKRLDCNGEHGGHMRELGVMADVVLNYRPKSRAKKAKRRKKRKAKKNV